MAKTDSKDDILAAGKKAFTLCEDRASDNRQAYKDDILFVRAREQWPEAIRKQREAEQRPCLTIDKLGPVIRQVVNDSRQNKPSIKVHPVDSNSDPETAEIINGLIRNIEYTSNADVAYDTAVECAVGGGFGYIRVGLDYAYDDTFDLDIRIERVANPLSVYPDPHSTAADSSDWNDAFVVDRLSREAFKEQYPRATATDWDSDAWNDSGDWLDSDGVMVAEWWHRETYDKTIVKTTAGQIYDEKDLTDDPDLAFGVEAGLLVLATDKLGQPIRRVVKCYRVIQRIMTGAEILSEREWPGQYIPIAPVYGDEFWIDGKRYLRSLINGAKDAQQMQNFWRTAGTELVALAPRVPYIGEEGAFDVSPEKWSTANTKSHPFLEYAQGTQAPKRQPLDSGVAAGSMQEALNASDDIKAITGIYDASLGARSNETSGRAIIARQRQGDNSTFHFIDNLARAIRHTGRIIIDLIPHVYDAPRIVRVIGEDGSHHPQPVNQQAPLIDRETGAPKQDEQGQAIMAIHDLTVGKYDLTVSTGPNYQTMRQETAEQMMQLIQAYPDAAPLIGDILVKSLDWQGADEIAERLKKMLPAQIKGEQHIPPEIQQAIEQGKQIIDQLTAEIEKLKAGGQAAMAKIEADKQAKAAQLASDQEMTMAEIASREAIAQAEIDSRERIAVATAEANARQRVIAAGVAANTPQPG
ncbi:portal protein [Devosia sp.]|uniref:portal protein n=1 Tax=Devosia sp. TaxID=1871048 RepID=UPI002AFE33D6|nr:portal protein [Devosia sp.]